MSRIRSPVKEALLDDGLSQTHRRQPEAPGV